MLIPSIDLMGGKVVQLIQGKRKALEFDDPTEWIARFRKFPLVQLIDLDAAMGKGSNSALIAHIATELPCQIGGGIRTVTAAEAALRLGAKRVILGSALFHPTGVRTDFAASLGEAVGRENIVSAIDTRGGQVSVSGWQHELALTPAAAITALEPYCAAFLYTHIETEGTMQGFPLNEARALRSLTQRQLIVAGGIRSMEEVATLDSIHVDAVVGMAIYTGLLAV